MNYKPRYPFYMDDALSYSFPSLFINDYDVKDDKDYGYLSSEDVKGLFCNNFAYRSCKAIEKRLKEFNFDVKVFNHDLFDTEYYVIKSNKWINQREICDALDIPYDWISLLTSEKWQWIIKQKEFNDKYKNVNGEIDFRSDIDVLWSQSAGFKIREMISKDLCISINNVFCFFDLGFIEIKIRDAAMGDLKGTCLDGKVIGFSNINDNTCYVEMERVL